MKYNLRAIFSTSIILILIATAFRASPVSYASEVTGTFSSSGQSSQGNTGGQPEQEDQNQSEEDDQLSGSVSSGESDGSRTGSSRAGEEDEGGSVLGAATSDLSTVSPRNSDTSSNSFEASTQSAPSSVSSGSEEMERSGGAEFARLAMDEEEASSFIPSLSTMGADEGSGIDGSAWFWMGLIALSLMGIAVYLYGRPIQEAERV